MSYEMHQTANLAGAAAAKGLRVVYPKENELFIDLDSEDALERFNNLLGIYASRHRCTADVRPSKTAGHYHAVVTLVGCSVDPLSRVFLQALLGSDPKRELLAHLQAEADGKDPVSVFYERA